MSELMKVGVISDTHGFFNTDIIRVFRDVSHIVHAGDIGREEVVAALRRMAPVTAVHGNGDYFPGWEKYRLVEFLQLNGKRLFITHEADTPGKLGAPMRELIASNKPHVVVYGHTHFPSIFKEDGILYFNPGLSGRAGYSGQPSVGILSLGDDVEAEIVYLDDNAFL